MATNTARLERVDRHVAEQTYSAEQAAALLGIGRSTFFRLAWFKGRKVRVSEGRVGYLASDVSLYQSLRRGVDRGV